MDSFVRYYKVPGLSHGFGTFNAKYDDLTALDHWVNSGRAPDVLIAVDENTEHSGRTRPMCAYPRWPKFTGQFPFTAESGQVMVQAMLDALAAVKG